MVTIDRIFQRLERWLSPWWTWPATLVITAVTALFLSLFFQPMGMEWVAWPGGAQFGDTCGMIQATGLPCPQCGMTRSWVHGIRGNLWDAAVFNPAGLVLLFWILAGGLIGAVRLITRDENRLTPPTWLLFSFVTIWLVPLYLGSFIARLAGYNVLP